MFLRNQLVVPICTNTVFLLGAYAELEQILNKTLCLKPGGSVVGGGHDDASRAFPESRRNLMSHGKQEMQVRKQRQLVIKRRKATV